MADQRTPRHVAIVGAGIVGLSTAWFLQERGVGVTVIDRAGVAAGSSWGNAGWLTPARVVPLPEPAVLRYGIRAVADPASPVYVPLAADRALLSFLARFVRNSTMPRWRTAMRALVPINAQAFAAFDELAGGGVDLRVHEGTGMLAAFRTEGERKHLIEGIGHLRSVGQPLEYDLLSGDEARAAEPCLSAGVGAAMRLHGQRFVDPGRAVRALADSVRSRGGRIVTGLDVRDVRDVRDSRDVRDNRDGRDSRDGRNGSGPVRLITSPPDVEPEPDPAFDAVVLATGAWLGGLAREFGVRTVVQAGRGYSFSVPARHLPAGPLYLPGQRVACTPLGDRLRLAGMMEFRSPDAPFDPRRISAIIEAARPLLSGVDFEARSEEWVGARPCTSDGLPLIGATGSDRIFVAGGHGMWGLTLGPITGRLLAEQITTGRPPAVLAPFDPRR